MLYGLLMGMIIGGVLGFAMWVHWRRCRRAVRLAEERASRAEQNRRDNITRAEKHEREVLDPLVASLIRCEREPPRGDFGSFCVRVECSEYVIHQSMQHGDMNGMIKVLAHSVAANFAQAVYGINSLRPLQEGKCT